MKNRFTGHTRLFLGISGAIIVIALIMQFVGVGLNLGIDFTGGSLLNYSVGQPYDVADVETILANAGYSGSQITKAAASEASIALQQEIADAAANAETASTETAAETTDEAAAEETETAEETAATEETATEETAAPEETAAAEETAATETETEETYMLNTDTSSIADDGKTDLQLRLNLVDETAGLEDAVDTAVKSVLPNASKITYTTLTNSMVVNQGYDGNFSGGFVIEYNTDQEFDSASVQQTISDALTAAGYSVADISVTRYDAAAEAAAAAETAAETEATEETAAAETEATEETAAAETEAADTAETTEETADEAAETTEAVEETGTDLRILVKINDESTKVRSIIEREMTHKYPNFRFVSIDHVSAIAGRDLLSNAVKALLIAFVCMLIYIAIRFDVFSGLAALFGLAHDILIMCSFMVFFRGIFQVNSSFIAAILTIVGYSINNTIIIFDRIREIAKKPGWTQKSRKEVVEEAVSNTLSRTINTSLTTLITLVALYIFGVSSIKEFAFPLIVGMLAGTYSSVLLSGQVWASWMDKRAAKKAAGASKTKKA